MILAWKFALIAAFLTSVSFTASPIPVICPLLLRRCLPWPHQWAHRLAARLRSTHSHPTLSWCSRNCAQSFSKWIPLWVAWLVSEAESSPEGPLKKNWAHLSSPLHFSLLHCRLCLPSRYWGGNARGSGEPTSGPGSTARRRCGQGSPAPTETNAEVRSADFVWWCRDFFFWFILFILIVLRCD